MPDPRPIGVFDSGLGGLTAVRELQKTLPFEDVIYFGDTGRVPYGSRGEETIIKYVKDDIRFLMSFDIKAMVVACGTAGAVALPKISPPPGLPMLGVLEPAAQAAAKATKSGRVGVIGTDSTIRSGAYERLLTGLNPDITVTAVACPLLVPLVENERFHPGDPLIELTVSEYMEPLQKADVDTLILGCTHYPLLIPVIQKHIPAALIDSGREVILALAERLALTGKQTANEAPGKAKYYVSDSTERFARTASIFLEKPVKDEVFKVDIDNILC